MTLAPVTSNPYTTYNGHRMVYGKVHQHSDVAVLVDNGSRSRKYSSNQSNVQAVPRDLWPGQQNAKGHDQFECRILYLVGNAGVA